MNAAAQPRSIVVEEVMPHSADKVWRMLTQADSLAQWLMPNDFKLAVGQKFTFRTKPMGEWDGVVHCEVLELVENQRLVYSWKGGSDDNDAYGSVLDSVATWTLEPAPGGTRVRLVHSGFRSPQNDIAYDAMNGGWGRVMQGISRVAAEAGGS